MLKVDINGMSALISHRPAKTQLYMHVGQGTLELIIDREKQGPRLFLSKIL